MTEENKTNQETSPDMITREQVIGVLKTCYDPEIPVDIWELGLIYELSVYGLNNIYVRMTLTSPACPVAGSLPGEVEQKLKEIPGANEVKVELTWDPPFETSMMSEEAKLTLGFM